MNKIMSRSIWLLLALLSWARPSLAAVPQVGQMAPEFKVMDQNGQIQTLDLYRGKWLVLYFYPKDETPGCTTEACAFRDDILKIKNLGAAVVGVSIGDVSSHADFAKNHHLPFPLLADKDGHVAELYGSEISFLGYKIAKRNTFIISPDGRISKVYKNVSPDSNPAEVVVELQKLKQGS